MKAGDKVKAVELYKLDKKSSINVGDVGVVKSITTIEDVEFVNVVFDKEDVVVNKDIVINEIGTYPLYEEQVELI